MPAPGLHAPRDHRLVVAGGAGIDHGALSHDVLASMPNCRHCWAIIEPARVIVGRRSPSTVILIEKGSPFGTVPLAAALAQARLDEELGRGLRDCASTSRGRTPS